MKGTILILLGVLLTAGAAVRASEETVFSGYLENRFFLVYNAAIPESVDADPVQLGNYSRIRLMIHTRPSDNLSARMAVDFFSFQGFLHGPLGVNSQDPGDEGGETRVRLDRAYVKMRFNGWDLSVGRQRVAMGVSYLWAPLDVFNRVNIFEPGEEKPGVDAATAYVSLGSHSGVTGVLAPGEGFQSSDFGLRVKTHWQGLDLALTWMQRGDSATAIYGVDLRGENVLGWWMEGGLFVRDHESRMKAVLGVDCTLNLGRGLYWISEFFFDGTGESDPGRYDYTLLQTGDRFTLGRWYGFSMLRYSFSEILNTSFTALANWTDGSYLAGPALQWEMFRNSSLTAGFYLPLGREGGEFNAARRSVLYCWFKVYF